MAPSSSSLRSVSPPERYSGHYRGWIETYWTPMQEIFADDTISEKTRARVEIDKSERIAKGQFRRRVSDEG